MPARSAEVRRQGASAVPAADRLGMDPELLGKTEDGYNQDLGGFALEYIRVMNTCSGT